MDLFHAFLNLFLHLDTHMSDIIQAYGTWTYLLLFIIVFCETGLVVTPFLPGDSLLFAAGTFAATGSLSLTVLLLLLSIAAVLGDSLNYAVGAFLGPKVFRSEGGWLLNREHLERTRRFYDTHGAKTIIIARFVPIIRTFAPFVAGIGRMRYETFILYNVIGGLGWVFGLTILGFGFGNIPVVRAHFSTVLLAIIALSLLPGCIEYLRARRASR